jgi:hypothetical protein
MKRLMTLVLVALLSLGVASISMAQEGTDTGGQAGASQAQQGKTKKHHKKKHAKKAKKGKKKQTPAAAETK